MSGGETNRERTERLVRQWKQDFMPKYQNPLAFEELQHRIEAALNERR